MVYQRIAAEEAFAPPELFKRYRALLDKGWKGDSGFSSLVGFYLTSQSPRIAQIAAQMEDLGELRQPGHRFFFGPDEVEPLS